LTNASRHSATSWPQLCPPGLSVDWYSLALWDLLFTLTSNLESPPVSSLPSSGVLVINIKGRGKTFLTLENVVFMELLSNPGTSAEAAPYHECLLQKNFKMERNYKLCQKNTFYSCPGLVPGEGERWPMSHCGPLIKRLLETPNILLYFFFIFKYFVQLISDSAKQITQCPS